MYFQYSDNDHMIENNVFLIICVIFLRNIISDTQETQIMNVKTEQNMCKAKSKHNNITRVNACKTKVGGLQTQNGITGVS